MTSSISLKNWLKIAAALVLLPALLACSEQPANSGETQSAAPDQAPASPGYRRINTPNPDDPLAAHIYELDNGLQVYLTENHEEPRFYAEIAVRAEIGRAHV